MKKCCEEVAREKKCKIWIKLLSFMCDFTETTKHNVLFLLVTLHLLWKISGSHSGVGEDSGTPKYNAVLAGYRH
jgi:hypothetical protein